jgi:hypothetical protein
MASRRKPAQPPSAGMRTSEFKVAAGLPALLASFALLLEWADKLPAWAAVPSVLISGMVCATALACAYVISRGLAKGAAPPPPPPQEE